MSEEKLEKKVKIADDILYERGRNFATQKAAAIPIDAHIQHSMAFHFRTKLMNIARPLSDSKIERAAKAFVDEYAYKPNATKVAILMVEWINHEANLTISPKELKPEHSRSTSDALMKIEHYGRITESKAFAFGASAANQDELESEDLLIQPDGLRKIATEIAERLLARIRKAENGSQYFISHDEYENLSDQLMGFMFPESITPKDKNVTQYSTPDKIGYTADSFNKAYGYMLRMGRSENYRSAVNQFFSQLMDKIIDRELGVQIGMS